MKTIFIVEGTAGEYEDREQWIVLAFTTHIQADAFAQRCNIEGRKGLCVS